MHVCVCACMHVGMYVSMYACIYDTAHAGVLHDTESTNPDL